MFQEDRAEFLLFVACLFLISGSSVAQFANPTGVFTINSCPPSGLTVTNQFGSQGTRQVTWNQQIVSSTAGSIASTSPSHYSGNYFSEGQTIVSITWTDDSFDPNQATCYFPVAINPNIFTIAGCPPSVSINHSKGTAQWANPMVSSSTSVTTTGPNIASRSSFKNGTTEVSYSYQDLNGNIASCEFTVTVDQTTPGRIINDGAVSKKKLGEKAKLDCTVYGNTEPVISWYDLDNNEITGDGDKYNIISTESPDKLFATKILEILNVERIDNGTYTCNITNTASNVASDLKKGSGEYYLVVIEKPEITANSSVAISSSIIEVTWTIDYFGNLPIDNCTIDYQDSNGKVTDPVDTGLVMADVFIYNITNLTPYTEYSIDVTCSNEVGSSATMPVPGSPVTTRQSNPGKPAGIGAEPEQLPEGASSSVAIITWKEPTAPNGPIAFYEVLLGERSPSRTTGKVEELRITGLTPGASYPVSVRAFNVEDTKELEGLLSDEIVVLTMPAERPSAPTNAEVANDPDQCVVTWGEPAEPNGVILGYTVYFETKPRTDFEQGVGETPNGDGVIEDITGLRYSVSKSTLELFTRYEYEVTASTSEGAGPREKANGYCYTDPGVPVGGTVAPPMGPDPEVPGSITSDTFIMQVQAFESMGGPVGCYEVIVIALEKGDELPSGPDQYPPDKVLEYSDCRAKAGCVYKAIVMNEQELIASNGMIVIGDNPIEPSTCNDLDALPPANRKQRAAADPNRIAENGQLQPSTSYTAFTRASILTGDGQVEYIESPLIPTVVTKASMSSPTVAVVVSFLLITSVVIIIVIIVFCIRRRRNNRPSHDGNIVRKSSEEENRGLEMDSNINTNQAQGHVTTMGQPLYGQSQTSSSTSTTVALAEHNLSKPEVNVQDYEEADEPTTEESWEIPWDKLMIGKTVLGEGNFGEVREGVVWHKDTIIKVAIKSLKDGASLMEEKDFMDEFGTMTKIGRHPNIVTLVGACKHEGTLYVALELIPHGNLRSFLREKRREDRRHGNLGNLSEQLMTFAMEVANGMRHLEDIGIIHRDLAARNVLLGEDYVAKVSDFGLSRDEDIYVKKSKTRVPVRWMAPESIQFSKYTSKSDVWSFGVLLWEIGALGGTPYAKIDSKELTNTLRRGYRMPKPDKCTHDMYEIMTNCWQFEADSRPSFRELHRTLSRMLEENQTYMTVEVYENVKLAPINPDRDDR